MSVTITLDTLLDNQPPHPHPTNNHKQSSTRKGTDQNSTTPTRPPQPSQREPQHTGWLPEQFQNPSHTNTQQPAPPTFPVKKPSFPHQKTLTKPPPQHPFRSISVLVTASRRQVKTLPTQPTTVKPQPRDPPHTPTKPTHHNKNSNITLSMVGSIPVDVL